MTAESLIAKASSLRAPSSTVVRLLTLLNDPDPDYEEVITIVSRDALLTGKLLALCNSASYGLARPVASIEQAVHYVGYCEVHRLVLAVSFGSQIGTELPGYSMEAGALWQHSVATAILTPRIARLSRNFDADTSVAYTAGLLHDIGKLVIDQTLNEATRDRIRHCVKVDGLPTLEAEKSVLGSDHAEIGACLLRRWRLPSSIVEAVASHHAPPQDGGARLSSVVHLADALTHQTGASPGWESFAIVVHAEAVTALGLSDADLDTLSMAAFECQDRLDHPGKPEPARQPERATAACAF